MFRVLDVVGSARPSVSEDSAAVAPPPAGTRRWIDLGQHTVDELSLLGERFDFHPLAIEDCAHLGQRPKLDDYGGYLFVVTQGFRTRSGDAGDLGVVELHAFVGPDYLVTVHEAPMASLEEVWSRVCEDPYALVQGVDFLYYVIADSLVDAQFPLVEALSDEIDDIQESVFSQPVKRDRDRIFQLKRLLRIMRQVFLPQRDMFAVLARRDRSSEDERTALYFRDIHDHLVRLSESLEIGRDLLVNALDAYAMAESNRTNEIMKRLTLMTAMFLPLTFLTGFFGQNFNALPFGSERLFWFAIGSCLALPAAMYYWFRKTRWL